LSRDKNASPFCIFYFVNIFQYIIDKNETSERTWDWANAVGPIEKGIQQRHVASGVDKIAGTP
jgi:hypothetical protein